MNKLLVLPEHHFRLEQLFREENENLYTRKQRMDADRICKDPIASDSQMNKEQKDAGWEQQEN